MKDVQPEEVVRHARRRSKKYRNPSMWYNGIRNPREALAAARQEIARRASSSLARVEWFSKITGFSSHGSWIDSGSAIDAASSANQRHPDIVHQVIYYHERNSDLLQS